MQLSQYLLNGYPDDAASHPDSRRQRAVGSRAALGGGPCFFFGDGYWEHESMSTASTCTTERLKERRSSGLIRFVSAPCCFRQHVQSTNRATSPPTCPGYRMLARRLSSTPIRRAAHVARSRDALWGFLAKTVWRPLANLPVAGRRIEAPGPVALPAGSHPVKGSKWRRLPADGCPAHGAQRKKRRKAPSPLPDALVAEVHAMEEKGSDVNPAAHLLNDAWKGLFDVAAVLSNDTDLVRRSAWWPTKGANRCLSCVRGAGRPRRDSVRRQAMSAAFNPPC